MRHASYPPLNRRAIFNTSQTGRGHEHESNLWRLGIEMDGEGMLPRTQKQN